MGNGDFFHYVVDVVVIVVVVTLDFSFTVTTKIFDFFRNSLPGCMFLSLFETSFSHHS